MKTDNFSINFISHIFSLQYFLFKELVKAVDFIDQLISIKLSIFLSSWRFQASLLVPHFFSPQQEYRLGRGCLILPGGCILRQLSFLSYISPLHPFQEKKKKIHRQNKKEVHLLWSPGRTPGKYYILSLLIQTLRESEF